MEFTIAIGVIAILVDLVCISAQLAFISNYLKKLVDQQDAQRANQDDPRY